MVAPVSISAVEDSFVRIAPKNNVHVTTADITQTLVENENDPNSPISRQVEDLVANQQRQIRSSLVSGAVSLSQSFQDDNKLNESSANEPSKSVVLYAAPTVTAPITSSTNEQSLPQQLTQERNNLFQGLPSSERRSVVSRMRSKMTLTERPQLRLATEEQQMDLIKKLEKDVTILKEDNMDLRRKVTLFQELFRDREKLDKILKKLEEKEKKN